MGQALAVDSDAELGFRKNLSRVGALVNVDEESGKRPAEFAAQ